MRANEWSHESQTGAISHSAAARGFIPAATAASRWLIFKLLFPHHFKTLSWGSIRLLSFQVCPSAHLQPGVTLLLQLRWGRPLTLDAVYSCWKILFSWREDKFGVVAKHLCTHTAAWGTTRAGAAVHAKPRCLGTTGFVWVGKSASFHTAEPTPKQNHDFHPGDMLWQGSVSLTWLL